MKITHLSQLPLLKVSHNPKISKKMMIEKGEIPHITNFSQATFPPGEVANEHFHSDMYEVFFIESGEGIISIDGQEYPIKKGTCITVSPHEKHELRNTGKEDLKVNYFGIINSEQ
jgi:mannose-6-phosphate isomerase-like protein (cupin superfamily)